MKHFILITLMMCTVCMVCGCGTGISDVSDQYTFPGAKKIEAVAWDDGSISRLMTDGKDTESVYLAKCSQYLDSFGGELTEWNEDDCRIATVTGGSNTAVVVAAGKYVYVAITEDTDSAIAKIKEVEGV